MSGVFQELVLLAELLFAPVVNMEFADFVRFFTEFVGMATRLFICLTVLFISISSYYKISRIDTL
jgi:hypothetical protein